MLGEIGPDCRYVDDKSRFPAERGVHELFIVYANPKSIDKMQRRSNMSLAPALEIGVWNAWILALLLYAAAFVPLAIKGERADKRMEGEPKGSELERTTRRAHVITHMIIMPLTLLLGIVTPMKLGTWWFYLGLPVYLLGLVVVLMFSISFATAPLGEPMVRGVYAISRHPQYLGFFLAYAGIGLACASWVYLLCALVWIASWQFGVAEEERILLEKYGEAYREYMARTPRWIGFPKRSEP
jgi:protein-S-isoprenylcysteine O-methyltransferase Ste14